MRALSKFDRDTHLPFNSGTIDNTLPKAHNHLMELETIHAIPGRPETHSLSLTRRMRDMTQEERRKVMASAAESLKEYYQTDPEI